MSLAASWASLVYSDFVYSDFVCIQIPSRRSRRGAARTARAAVPGSRADRRGSRGSPRGGAGFGSVASAVDRKRYRGIGRYRAYRVILLRYSDSGASRSSSRASRYKIKHKMVKTFGYNVLCAAVLCPGVALLHYGHWCRL